MNSSTVLTCSYSASDADGDTTDPILCLDQLSTNTSYSSTLNTLQLDPSNSEPSNIIQCEVTVSDLDGGSDSGSISVTVENTAPSFSSGATITPSSSITTGMTLTCSAVATDDYDGVITPTYVWMVGSNQVATSDTYVVDAGDTDVGDSIECTATAVDSSGASVASSATVTVINTAPSLGLVTITPNTGVYNDDSLSCSAAVSDPDETLIASYSWTVAGTAVGSGSTLDLATTAALPADSVCVLPV